MKNYIILIIAITLFASCQTKEKVNKVAEDFPFFISKEKPNRKLSAAVARNYDAYENIRPEQTTWIK